MDSVISNMEDPLNIDLSEVKGFGPKILERIEKANFRKIKDLLFYFPFRYEDYSHIQKLKDLKIGEKNVFIGKIIATKFFRSFRKRISVFEVLVEDLDKTGIIKSTWFNQPYLTKSLKKGYLILLAGTVKLSRKYSLNLQSPYFEILDESSYNTKEGKIIPVYHTTSDVSSGFVRFLLKKVKNYIKNLPESLPKDIVKKENLPSLKTALNNIHYPKTIEEAQIARQRFVFENLFYLQVYLQKQFLIASKENTYKIIPKKESLIKFTNRLPFDLTKSQKKTLREILIDLQRKNPMRRLLQGEVGSGKTLVAFISILNVVENGYQCILMAPTEILALQHFNEAKKLFQNFPIKICLLTNKFSLLYIQNEEELVNVKREKMQDLIRLGDIRIIIGTHALLSSQIYFKNLAYIVVDEQHRFGVKQRQEIIKKASRKSIYTQNIFLKPQDKQIKRIPHFLSMSATPIPRTLSLTLYGNLELSRIEKIEKNRETIITKIAKTKDRNEIYEFIKKEIIKKRQVFIICPLIEESEILQVKSAIKEKEYLEKNIFKDFNIGLIHGKVSALEKENIMKDFMQGKIQILVATPVVEVGINNQNATVMLIEGSERFGLSQLHQLRGRVGRGKHKSYCFLFMENFSLLAYKRLQYLVKSDDGFFLAEQDLKIRGPGEFLGERQHGFPDVLMEGLKETGVILKAKKYAIDILEKDFNLDTYPYLKNKIKEFQQEIHLE